MASKLNAVWAKRQAEAAGSDRTSPRMPKAPAGASALDELHLDVIKGGSAESFSEFVSIICAQTVFFCGSSYVSCTV